MVNGRLRFPCPQPAARFRWSGRSKRCWWRIRASDSPAPRTLPT